MMDLFTGYILPFLAFGLIVAGISFRVKWAGGPGMIAIVFFAIIFGPSLVYALIADDSSTLLFLGSLVAALTVCGFMFFRWHKRKNSF